MAKSLEKRFRGTGFTTGRGPLDRIEQKLRGAFNRQERRL